MEQRYRDRDDEIYERFTGSLRSSLRALIDDDLIEEHRARPLGKHSDRLARVLHYFRSAPQSGKYIIVAVEPWKLYRIAELTGVRGHSASIREDLGSFVSEEDALHGVFLARVRDLQTA